MARVLETLIIGHGGADRKGPRQEEVAIECTQRSNSIQQTLAAGFAASWCFFRSRDTASDLVREPGDWKRQQRSGLA